MKLSLPMRVAILGSALALGLCAADGPAPKKPADAAGHWYQLKPGEFPPEGTSHLISGELIAVDHVNRTGMIRQDRDDTQRRADWDLPRRFVLLPYGSVRYHGSPAELRDIPIGTHLHGEFYADEAPAEPPTTKGKGKASPQAVTFTRVIRLEDDVSRNLRLGRSWRVENYNPETMVLSVVGVNAQGQADPKPTLLQVTEATRFWKGRGVASASDLSPGQLIQANLTYATLFGPGRCLDVWLDAESLALAGQRQLGTHRVYQREHGLAGFVRSVDNKAKIVTIDLFDGCDPKLLEDVIQSELVAVVVAEETLRTYDQVNDFKRGPVLEVKKLPPQPGFSGLRLSFKPSELLEGFRPQRVVRVFASTWRIISIPREEQLYR